MSSSDCREQLFELHLVSSYMPMLLLLLRSVLLVFVVQAVAPFLFDSSVFALLSVLVYFDALFFWRDALNRVAGFLLPTAFVLFVNFRGALLCPLDTACQRPVQFAPYWATDVAWAASSSVVFVSLCMQVPLRVRIFNVTVSWACMALAHVMLGCLRPYALAELLGRLLLYYTSCAFFFLSSMVLPGVDRNLHSFTVVHVNMHVLFVEVYVLAVSVAISVAAYLYIYYQYSARAAQGQAGPRALPEPGREWRAEARAKCRLEGRNESRAGDRAEGCAKGRAESCAESLAESRAENRAESRPLERAHERLERAEGGGGLHARPAPGAAGEDLLAELGAAKQRSEALAHICVFKGRERAPNDGKLVSGRVRGGAARAPPQNPPGPAPGLAPRRAGCAAPRAAHCAGRAGPRGARPARGVCRGHAVALARHRGARDTAVVL